MQFVLFWFSLSIETAVLLVSLESKQSESMLRIQLSTRDEMQITQVARCWVSLVALVPLGHVFSLPPHREWLPLYHIAL